MTVTLRADGGERREIRYTTDGSEPTAASTRYTGPFLLERSATVQAMAAHPGGLQLMDTTGLGPYREWSAAIALRAGFHPVTLKLSKSKQRMQPELTVRYSGPGISKQAVPGAVLLDAGI